MRLLIPLLLTTLSPAAQLSLERPQRCAMADTVVTGEVTSTEVRWSDDAGGGIETVVWLAVDRVHKGKVGDTLELVLPGGTLGELTHFVEDVPTLVENQSYLVMLQQGAPVGGEQGVIPVRAYSDQHGESVGAAIRSLGECR